MTFGFDGETLMSLFSSDQDIQHPCFSKLSEITKQNSEIQKMKDHIVFPLPKDTPDNPAMGVL